MVALTWLGGDSCMSAAKYGIRPSRLGAPQNVNPTSPPGHTTRRASRSASSFPFQIPLKLVATSNWPSPNGRSNMSPTRRSASGMRARAIAISASEASRAATTAPRPAATLAAYPEPQAMSSSRVPGPTPARSYSASLAGRAYGSIRYAQSAARSPQARPDSIQSIALVCRIPAVYGAGRRRRPAMTRARPARAISGPSIAQVVVPDMKLPPMTPTPCRVKTTPVTMMSDPAPISRTRVIKDIRCLPMRQCSGNRAGAASLIFPNGPWPLPSRWAIMSMAASVIRRRLGGFRDSRRTGAGANRGGGGGPAAAAGRPAARAADRGRGGRVRHRVHRGQLAVGADLLPRGGRRAVDGDRPVRGADRGADPGPDVHRGPGRVHGPVHAEDGPADAHPGADDARGRVPAGHKAGEPVAGQPEPRLAGRLLLRGRGDGRDRARRARAGQHHGAGRDAQAAAGRGGDRHADAAVHLHRGDHRPDAGRDPDHHDQGGDTVSEPKGRGAAWTEERSDEGRRRLKAPRRR